MEYLRHHTAVTSTDVDEVRELLTGMTSRHEIDLPGVEPGFDARVAAVSVGAVNLLHFGFGNLEMEVSASGDDDDGILVYIVTDGAGTMRIDGENRDFSEQKAIIRELAYPIHVRQRSFGSFALPLSKKRMLQHARTLVGDRPELREIAFDPSLDMNSPEGLMFRSTIHYLAKAFDGPLRDIDNPMVTAQLEEMLLTQALNFLPNSLQDIMKNPAGGNILPYQVKRARDHIHANLDAKITLADISAAAGCGYRTLQQGFKDAYGMPPMAYVRFIRLKQIRAQILSGEISGSLAEMAQRSGFAHLGRFAQAYRAQFGELPSETLRRRS